MRLSPAAAGVEATGTMIVGLLLRPSRFGHCRHTRGWLRTGHITGLSDAELSELLWRAGDEVARRLREG